MVRDAKGRGTELLCCMSISGRISASRGGWKGSSYCLYKPSVAPQMARLDKKDRIPRIQSFYLPCLQLSYFPLPQSSFFGNRYSINLTWG